MQIRQITEQAKQGNLTAGKLEALNAGLKDLVAQVKAIDGEILE